MSYKSRTNNRYQGFSFMEVMVVVVIIGLLAGTVAIKVSDYIDKANQNRVKSDITTISNAVESYYADKGRFPSSEEGLTVLPLKKTKDPWGNTYQYNRPGQNEPYEIICYGADGREGGEGADKDISSELLEEES